MGLVEQATKLERDLRNRIAFGFIIYHFQGMKFRYKIFLLMWIFGKYPRVTSALLSPLVCFSIWYFTGLSVDIVLILGILVSVMVINPTITAVNKTAKMIIHDMAAMSSSILVLYASYRLSQANHMFRKRHFLPAVDEMSVIHVKSRSLSPLVPEFKRFETITNNFTSSADFFEAQRICFDYMDKRIDLFRELHDSSAKPFFAVLKSFNPFRKQKAVDF